MPRHFDTIAALATPTGTSAVAVLRVSGPDTQSLTAAIMSLVPPPRRARHGDYRVRSGEVIDDVVFTYYQLPHSYTGEDSLEISCHGSPFIAQRILGDLLARGCRAAEPGEFTQRAFLNGKMDLSQAEAVMDLIQARSDRALAAANQQLRGSLTRRMEEITGLLLAILARVEAYIDFPDEDLPPEDVAGALTDISRLQLLVNDLRSTSRYGSLLRDGVKTVILGAPNAGKSSLLNRLVGSERALVSPEPGTTRDFIEERISVGPHLLRLIDTAGLNEFPTPLERRGIQKTFECLQEADLVLVVLDASASPAPLPDDVVAGLAAERTLVVVNKCDLPTAAGFSPDAFRAFRQVRVSALTGVGVELLREEIAATIDRSSMEERDDFVAINARHAQALDEARVWLQQTAQKLEAREAIELVASDLRGVLTAIGQITGRVDNERMLDLLFASFCIGK